MGLGRDRQRGVAGEREEAVPQRELARDPVTAAASALRRVTPKCLSSRSLRVDRERGDLYMALGRYNGSLGKADYPNLVLGAWKGRWQYDGPTA